MPSAHNRGGDSRTARTSSGLRSGTLCVGALLAAVVTAGCGSSSQTSTAPTSTKCAVTVQAGGATTFPAAGGSGAVNVTTNRECAWSVQSDAGWLTLGATATGRGNGAVDFKVAANGDPAPRATQLRVEDQRIEIAQQAAPCELQLSSTEESFSPAGGERTVHVRASSAACTWTAVPDESWIAIASGREGQGDGDVRVRVAPASGPPRSGAVAIGGRTVRITQSECAIVVEPLAVTMPAAGGERSVHVRASSAACTWTAVPDAPWITIPGGSDGRGDGDVRIRAAATSGPPRSGTVAVAGRVVQVTQSACAFVVEPVTVTIPAAGGGGVITVRAEAGCPWTASSDADWLAISGGGAGAGSGEVQFSAAAYDGPGRTGSLRVAGHTVAVTQGSGCAVSFQPSRFEVGSAGGTETVDITAGAGCEWSVASRAPWLSITSAARGTGTARVAVAIAPNPGPARSGELAVGDRTIVFTQASGCRYTVTPAAIDVAAGGGAASVALATTAGCSWTAASGSPWITLLDPAGSGPGQVGVSVAPNLSPARSGTFTVAGQTVSVTQPSSCQYEVRPRSAAYDAKGGMGSVLVVVSGPCSWTTVSRSAWITVVHGATGAGDGLMQFVVEANGGAARTGHLTVAGFDFVVTQSAPQ